MKYLLVFLCLAACAMAMKDTMLMSNRVPTDVQWTTTCDECQSFVHRFHDALKDPKKLNELKFLLRFLCGQTSHPDQCKTFVNNLDQIIDKMEPYLEDATAVCKKIHMCANKRIDAFHKIGMLYASRYLDKQQGYKDLFCDECQFVANELKKEIDDKKIQLQIRDFLRSICAHMGQIRGMCDMLSEEFLPEFFAQMDAVLSHPKQTCAKIGFCQAALGAPKFEFAGFMKFMEDL